MAFMFELVSELTWLSLSSGLHLVFLLDTSIRHTPTWVKASSSSGPVVLHVSSHLWRSWTSCPAAVRDAPLSSLLPFLLSGNILIVFTRLYDTFHLSLRMPRTPCTAVTWCWYWWRSRCDWAAQSTAADETETCRTFSRWFMAHCCCQGGNCVEADGEDSP